MSTAAICVVSVCALLAFGSLVEAVKQVLVVRAQPPACPCRDLHSITLTPGSVFELPPGTNLATATEADPRFVSYTQKPKEPVNLRDLVLVDVDDDGTTEDKLGLNCSLMGEPTTLGWLIDDHSECRTKLGELMAYVTGGVLSKQGNDLDDVIGFARAAELHRLVEDHPTLVNSKLFMEVLKHELGEQETTDLAQHADHVAARRSGNAAA